MATLSQPVFNRKDFRFFSQKRTNPGDATTDVQVDSNSAALCFTETWLSEAIPDNALHLPSYKLFRAYRIAELTGKTRGGGLCFYINEGWYSDVTTLKMTCSPNLEALFINCKLFNSPREFSSFILMNVYVPPDACVSPAMQQLAEQISERSPPETVIYWIIVTQ